jgi:hypothetical protein
LISLFICYTFSLTVGLPGWVLGNHQVEEVENRMLAAHGGAVVVSVDYRMAPEYKFPYAVNDCFDAFRWASPAQLPLSPLKSLTAHSAKPVPPIWESTPHQSLLQEEVLGATS